jgi:hypothetical protein
VYHQHQRAQGPGKDAWPLLPLKTFYLVLSGLSTILRSSGILVNSEAETGPGLALRRDAADGRNHAESNTAVSSNLQPTEVHLGLPSRACDD